VDGRWRALTAIKADPLASAWRKTALQAGFRSSISIPLAIDGEAIGALTI
jgi:hypothetical protein